MLLSVQSLCRAFGGVQAVDGVSFDVAEGSMMALIGPNGAGKTTCFGLLNGQLKPDAGRVMFMGADIAGLAQHRVSRRGIGRTFQVAAAFGSMTVRENVQVALLSHAGRLAGVWRRAAAHDIAQAEALLARVGLLEQGSQRCAELSYGDIKRLELALALAGRPRLLLMDEPTAGMAVEERRGLMDLVSGLAREGMAVLFTEHDMDVVFGHADRVVVMNRGKAIREGSPEEVRADPEVRRIYLGAST